MSEQELKAAADEAAQMIDSPLFKQIACMMAVCTAAKTMVDKTEAYNAKGNTLTTEEIKELNTALGHLCAMLADIDFEHGQEIVAGALDACRLAQPHVDIICSGFSTGMPPKKDNINKLMFIKGGIGVNKGAIIYMDQKGAEQLIADFTRFLDILYPQRLVGIKPAGLITH